MKAERWDEKHWDGTDHERTGRGKETVMLMLNHAQNHLWREVWGVASGAARRRAVCTDLHFRLFRMRNQRANLQARNGTTSTTVGTTFREAEGAESYEVQL